MIRDARDRLIALIRRPPPVPSNRWLLEMLPWLEWPQDPPKFRPWKVWI